MARLAVKTGIAVFVLAGALAVLGAGTAAATKLCTTEGVLKTCPAGKEVKASAPLKLTQVANAQFPIGIALVECKSSTLEGEITNAGGGGGVPVKATLKTLGWGDCTCGVKALNTPWAVTFAGTGNRDGDMSYAAKLEFNCDGTKCEYSDVLTSPVKGDVPAILEVGVSMTKVGGAGDCANPGQWAAQYKFTEPSPMWVTEK